MIYNFFPYAPNGTKDLGQAYNDHMELIGADDWALLVDHDVMMLGYDWYPKMEEYILKYPKAGVFTCFTNRINCAYQKYRVNQEENDIAYHWRLANQISKGLQAQEITKSMPLMSGMLMLVKKSAWLKAGKFTHGIFGVDNEFHKALRKQSITVYLMKSIYVYHYYRNNTNNTDHLRKKL